jgi:hypothetical protein
MKTKATPTDAVSDDAPTTLLPRKLGADHSETATHPRKHDNNFKQSKDLREDRGIRQLKSSPKNHSSHG